MAALVLLVPLLIHAPSPFILAIQIAVGAIFYLMVTFWLQRMKLHSVFDGLLPTRT
jgi:hypothetical protein